MRDSPVVASPHPALFSDAGRAAWQGCGIRTGHNDKPPMTTKEAIRRADPRAETYTYERCFINELSNFDGDPEVSIARARVEPGVTTRWHRLRDTTERYVVLSGRGRVEVGELPSQEVGPSDVVLIPPGCRQRIACIDGEPLIFLAVCSPRFRQDAYEDIEDDVCSGR
jgi:mannose-6-phosphate isomerase-like protein (cupin superfamily)